MRTNERVASLGNALLGKLDCNQAALDALEQSGQALDHRPIAVHGLEGLDVVEHVHHVDGEV